LALDQPFSSLDSAPLLQPLDVGKLAGFDAARNVIAGSAARISLWRPPQGTAAVAPTSSDAALPLPASIRSLASGRGVASSRPVTRQSVQATGGGSTLVSTALANVLPGRRMTATKRSNLEQNLAPGTAVQFRADRGNLLVGTNTLMVVVIDPGGVRYQQVVSFGVTAPVDLPSSAIPKLPLLPGRASPKPVPAPNQIDLHFNANLIADRLKKGQAFLTQHSVQHLQEFRR